MPKNPSPKNPSPKPPRPKNYAKAIKPAKPIGGVRKAVPAVWTPTRGTGVAKKTRPAVYQAPRRKKDR